MSILAASVCLNNGEVILSRQFVELSAARVHDMLSKCPLLLEESDRTTLEVDGLRYICEPLDELYVILISDAETSNILQDLKTLHLLTQLVKQIAAPNATNVDESDVVASTFSIIDSFDEVITMGFHENLTESQVDTFLKMESYEERIQQIIEHNKQLEAAENRKRMAKKLDAERMAAKMEAPAQPSFQSDFSSFKQPQAPVPETRESLLTGLESKRKATGLKLGNKNAQQPSELASLPPATKQLPVKLPQPAESKSTPVHAQVPISTTTDVSIVEHLTIEALRDGTIKQSRVSGTLSLVAGDREHSKLRIKTKTDGAPSDYKPHPKMDRALFASERSLGLKNSDEQFPASQVLLVKWTADNAPVPLQVSCWVSDASDAGFKTVTLEYEVVDGKLLGKKLEDITIQVPLPSSNAHASDPSSNFEQFDDHIVWNIPEADQENSTGSFEFVAEGNDEDDFYPLEISFKSVDQSEAIGKIDVLTVTDASSNEEIEFTKTVTADTTSYIVR